MSRKLKNQPKLHFGSRGGVYYKSKGKKIYLKPHQYEYGFDNSYMSNFGSSNQFGLNRPWWLGGKKKPSKVEDDKRISFKRMAS